MIISEWTAFSFSDQFSLKCFLICLHKNDQNLHDDDAVVDDDGGGPVVHRFRARGAKEMQREEEVDLGQIGERDLLPPQRLL